MGGNKTSHIWVEGLFPSWQLTVSTPYGGDPLGLDFEGG